MKELRSHLLSIACGFLFFFISGQTDLATAAGSGNDQQKEPTPATDNVSQHDTNRKILVELFLSKSYKGNKIDEIIRRFDAFSITKIRPQYFPLGNPPENIAIGTNIPADVARMAIEIAGSYNQGIRFIIAEKRLAPDYIAIGTSMFDERLQIPVSPEDLKNLTDPALTTSQFHAVYRHLSGDDRPK